MALPEQSALGASEGKLACISSRGGVLVTRRLRFVETRESRGRPRWRLSCSGATSPRPLGGAGGLVVRFPPRTLRRPDEPGKARWGRLA